MAKHKINESKLNYKEFMAKMTCDTERLKELRQELRQELIEIENQRLIREAQLLANTRR